jgi:regulator of protease activity HflC (stomatin/prohibitin superfamily)
MLEELIVLGIGIIFAFIFIIPGFAVVRDNEVGIVTKKMFGSALPQGKIIAIKGEVGVQADQLMPGLYWRFPIIWKIEKVKVVIVSPGQIGLVEAVDGEQLKHGRLLGDNVECKSFQDAKAFLTNGGMKGAQVEILKPGVYRVNLKVFKVTVVSATEIKKETVGMVIAKDGIPLPSEYIVAPEPVADHKHFTDGQSFINGEGYRGPQLETLQPGVYYINLLLFEINTADVAVVNPGYVAVIISSVGKELNRSFETPVDTTTPNLNQPIHSEVETLLITNEHERGILRKPVAPGKYNLNRIAYRVEPVPTSAIMINWASGDARKESDYKEKPMSNSDISAEFFKFNALKATAKDGFQLLVDVKLILRIAQENAAFVIARFGTVSNLIEQVAHPLIDSSFRNEAGNNNAMVFMEKRTEFQKQAFEKAVEEFRKYHVEVQGLMVGYIDLDKSLLETQTKKQIAVQQQEQYQQEAKAQEQRIAVAEKTAQADKQPDVMAAKLSIGIAKDKAIAMVNEAEGIRDATKTKAEGTAFEQERVGQAIAAAYKSQADVVGSDKVAAIKLMQEIASGKVVITPNVQVSSGSGESTNLLTALIAKWLSDPKSESKVVNVLNKGDSKKE